MTPSYPLVSVITPVYNGESWIEETLDSISASDYPNLELIVINDGSTDSTLKILNSYQANCRRVLRVIDKPNGGESDAVNVGVGHSQGKYLVIVNADDPIYPTAISKLTVALENDLAAVVAYPDWHMINGQGQITNTVVTPDYSRFKLVCENNCIPGPGALIRKSAIKEQLRDTSVRYIPDYEAWLRLSREGHFVRVPEVLATWRNHLGGASTYVRGAGPANEMVRVMKVFLKSEYAQGFTPREAAIARMNSYGRGAAQSLMRQGVPGRRYAFGALFYACVARKASCTLDPVAFLAILANPFGLWLYRYWYRDK